MHILKLLASQGKYDEAISNCLSILQNLGEVFCSEVSLDVVRDELSSVHQTLENISYEQIKTLPQMTDTMKVTAMHFMSMLCTFSVISKPMLLVPLSCRMLRLTMTFGFCEDSIVGLGQNAYAVVRYTFAELLSFLFM